MNHQARLELIEQAGEKFLAPCADGDMPFRVWKPSGGDQIGSETVVLLHGGSGAWNHWCRNIDALSTYYQLIIPDLPGLGDAASLPDEYRPEDAADWVLKGIRQVTQSSYHIVAFSWGSVVASLIARADSARVKSIMLVGPASMGIMPEPLAMKPLLARNRTMSAAEIKSVTRENLKRLMIHADKKIDDFAVYLHDINTRRSRFRSPQFAKGTYVLDGLVDTSMPIKFIYGEKDASAYPNISTRRTRAEEVRPDCEFEIVPGAGHWLQYEMSEKFNVQCIEWIDRHCFP